MAYIASAMKAPVKRFGYRAMHAQNCIDTHEGSWNKSQPTLGAGVRTSAFASMCLADDDLVGDQHSSGGLVSSSQETMTSSQGWQQCLLNRLSRDTRRLSFHFGSQKQRGRQAGRGEEGQSFSRFISGAPLFD
jgi:hypothetical protein